MFGLTSSPFLLGATLNYHLEKVPDRLRTTAKKLQNSLYVNNCVASVDTIEHLKTFQSEATEIMNLGHFVLRGWETNIDVHDNDGKENNTNVLGLRWDRRSDTLRCVSSPHLLNEGQRFTRRRLLSLTQRIFDLIRFLSPSNSFPRGYYKKP